MSWKLVSPYILVILLFDALIYCTMVLTYDWLMPDSVFAMPKLRLQVQLSLQFGFLIPALVGLNIIERIFSKQPHLGQRLLKSIVTLIIIDLTNWLFHSFAFPQTHSFYHNPDPGRNAPVLFFSGVILIFIAVFVIIFETLTRSPDYPYIRNFLGKLIPGFIRKHYLK